MKKFNFGLIIEPPRAEDYILGTTSPLDKAAIFPDGHGWGNFLPEKEFQYSTEADFMNCVTESAQNCLEMLSKARFNLNWNDSGRYTANLSGTTKSGNTQRNVSESIRKNNGLIPEYKWPRTMTMTWDEFYSPIPRSLQREGLTRLDNWTINYEWVNTDKESLKEALKYGPLQVTGFAWGTDNNNLYSDFGKRPNHAFCLYDYKDGEYWLIYDSYPTDYQLDPAKPDQEFIKKLSWDFTFGSAMQYSLKPNFAPNNLLLVIYNFMKEKVLVLFHGKGKNTTGIFWFIKEVNDVWKRQQISSAGAVMMFLWIWIEAFKKGELGIIKNTDWGEISQFQLTDEFFK